MSRTYTATGINLKGVPLGESDRLLTVLTREYGLIRAVAPGARKHNSKLGGRSGLFVVNQLLVAKGRSLDKITQAETIESYPALSQDLGKLTAGQYLAELVLCQALSEQPQEELFSLLNEHLTRLAQAPTTQNHPAGAATVLALLAHATFHLLALGGVAPQVYQCCLTRRPVQPNLTHPNWKVGFSIAGGGVIDLSPVKASATPGVTTDRSQSVRIDARLQAVELVLLQSLTQPDLLQLDVALPAEVQNGKESEPSYANWLVVERILRHYAQYHFDRSIRSAALIETCFPSVPTPEAAAL